MVDLILIGNIVKKFGGSKITDLFTDHNGVNVKFGVGNHNFTIIISDNKVYFVPLYVYKIRITPKTQAEIIEFLYRIRGVKCDKKILMYQLLLFMISHGKDDSIKDPIEKVRHGSEISEIISIMYGLNLNQEVKNIMELHPNLI